MKSAIAFFISLCLGISVQAANIVIVNLDGAGEGFNDPTPATPEGGNTGTTRGEQRLIVFQTAARIWSALLKSNVTIHVGANFDPLTPCGNGSGVLGSAGPLSVLYDVALPPSGLQINTWYPISLYESRSGVNENAGNNEIKARFNSDIDNGCVNAGTRFWYGIDPNIQKPAGTFSLFPTVMHELGHGLGFLTFVCTNSSGCGSSAQGEFLKDNLVPIPDIWTRFMADTTMGGPNTTWDQLSTANRVQSMTNDPNLIWKGTNVGANISNYQPNGGNILNMGYMRLHAPTTLQPGSSVSHWSSDAANPNLLMESALSAGVFNDTDLTYSLFQDIGWLTNPRDTLFTDNFDTQ